MVSILLIFLETAKLFSKAVVQFNMVIQLCMRVPVTPYPNQYLVQSFLNPSNKCVIVLHCDLNFISLMLIMLGILFFFFFKGGLFKKIYFWLHWLFIAARKLSLVAASGGYSLLPCAGFSLRWLLLLQGTGSRHTGFSSCGTQAQ